MALKTNNIELAKRIKETVEGVGAKSARQFAISIPIDTSQFNKVKNGEIGLSYEMAKAICDKYPQFHITTEWLLDGTGNVPIWNNVPREKTGLDESQVYEEQIGYKNISSKRQANANSDISMKSLFGLVESNKILAEANRNISEANRDLAKNTVLLTTMLNAATVNDHSEMPLTVVAKFADVLELLAEVGSGNKWHSKDEATAEIHRRFYGTTQSKKEGGTQVSVGT